MSAAPSQVPAVAVAQDRRYRPLVFIMNQEAASRFPEKTSKWSVSQLVCQPRPLSLATHASRGSVARLEQMADLHWSEQPPTRPDHSLYVYYTYALPAPPSSSHPSSPSYELASTSTANMCDSALSSSFSMTSEEMAYAMEMLDQFNEATELLEYQGQPFLALQADGQVVPFSMDVPFDPSTPFVMDQHLSSPYAQFPPISPPASSLPIPSCLREASAPGITGEEDYVPRAFRNPPAPASGSAPALNWPPTSPPASSLPVPSWYASLASCVEQSSASSNVAGGSSKDRAHKQHMMEKRRARRSSPNSTPRPTLVTRSDRSSDWDNNVPTSTSASSTGKSGHGATSSSSEGVKEKGKGGRRRKALRPLYTFAPRDNFEGSPPQPPPRTTQPSDPFRYVAAPPLLTQPLSY